MSVFVNTMVDYAQATRKMACIVQQDTRDALHGQNLPEEAQEEIDEKWLGQGEKE